MAYRKRPLARRPARKARKPRRRVGRKAVAKICKRVITNMAEKKTVRYNWAKSFGAYNTTNWSLDGIYPLTPQASFTDIAQGTGQGNRVGNRITVRKLIFNGIMNTEGYDINFNASPQPLEVLMVIFRNRADPNTFTTNLTNFFQNGNGASSPNGTTTDTIFPINTDRYTVYYKRIFKLGFAEYNGTGVDSNNQKWSNNDYKLNQRFYVDCTKYVNKVMRFNDTVNTPITPVLHVAFLPMRADGSGVSAATNAMMKVSANWQLDYFDV